MAVRLLQLLVSNGNAVTFTRHTLLIPMFPLRLRSGRFHKCYWLATSQTFTTPLPSDKHDSNKPVTHSAHFKISTLHYTDKLHSVEHFTVSPTYSVRPVHLTTQCVPLQTYLDKRLSKSLLVTDT
jgi:hypothetical protein